jgi:hypothetical protein
MLALHALVAMIPQQYQHDQGDGARDIEQHLGYEGDV